MCWQRREILHVAWALVMLSCGGMVDGASINGAGENSRGGIEGESNTMTVSDGGRSDANPTTFLSSDGGVVSGLGGRATGGVPAVPGSDSGGAVSSPDGSSIGGVFTTGTGGIGGVVTTPSGGVSSDGTNGKWRDHDYRHDEQHPNCQLQQSSLGRRRVRRRLWWRGLRALRSE